MTAKFDEHPVLHRLQGALTPRPIHPQGPRAQDRDGSSDGVASSSDPWNRGDALRRASVAMVLRPSATAVVSQEQPGGAENVLDLEIALIERARRDGDPWSGQVAMPGGRADAGDRDLVETAIRETREEVGLRLHRDFCLGALGTHRAHTRVPAMAISGFVFGVDRTADFGSLEVSEVASASWTPLQHLIDPAAVVRYRFTRTMDPFPAVLLPDGYNVLWGLTYRFVDRMLGHLGQRMPEPTPDSPVLDHASI